MRSDETGATCDKYSQPLFSLRDFKTSLLGVSLECSGVAPL